MMHRNLETQQLVHVENNTSVDVFYTIPPDETLHVMDRQLFLTKYAKTGRIVTLKKAEVGDDPLEDIFK